MSEQLCPGSGRKWKSGMGRAVCPTCHRSASSLGATQVKAPRQWQVMKGKEVPAHEALTV